MPSQKISPTKAHKPIDVHIKAEDAKEFLRTHSLSILGGDLIITSIQVDHKPEPSPTYIEISSINVANPRSPQVPHIHLSILAPHSSKGVWFKAMQDTGCAKSVIRMDAIERIPAHEKIAFRKLLNVFVKSGTGDKQGVRGLIILQVLFTAKMEKPPPFSMTF
jgi:hypothetical protein